MKNYTQVYVKNSFEAAKTYYTKENIEKYGVVGIEISLIEQV